MTARSNLLLLAALAATAAGTARGASPTSTDEARALAGRDVAALAAGAAAPVAGVPTGTDLARAQAERRTPGALAGAAPIRAPSPAPTDTDDARGLTGLAEATAPAEGAPEHLRARAGAPRHRG